MESPRHIAPLGLAVVDTVGRAFTLTFRVAWSVHPFASVPVIVYTVVTVGLAVTLVPVVADSPVAGAHV